MSRKIIRTDIPFYTVGMFKEQSGIECRKYVKNSRSVVCIELPLLGKTLKFHYHHKMHDFLGRHYKGYPDFLNKLAEKNYGYHEEL